MDIGYSPRCAEGGTSQYLSLFVPDRSRRLKPSTARLATLRYDGLRYGAAALDAELGLMNPWPELLRPWIP